MEKIFPASVLIFVLSFILFISPSNIKAQTLNTDLYEYLSPVPGARMVMPSTRIIIRYGKSFATLSPGSSSDIRVVGDKSGFHEGKLMLLENNEILTFIPESSFDYGEKVSVEMQNKFQFADGTYAPHLKYTFMVTEKVINADNYVSGILQSEPLSKKINNTFYKTNIKDNSIRLDSLPEDFPYYDVYTDNPTNGYLFFAPFVWPFINSSYLIISDNYGIPVFYRKESFVVFDFQKQPNGNITFFNTSTGLFEEMNNKYELINTHSMQNGYATDLHEIRILETGHCLMFSYDPQIVRMDTLVAGGDSNAVVIGLVMQELDENNNLLFQWRSWDHYKITDATYDISLTDSVIDYVHANAIEVDYDGNILLSCRHMDEITKINRTTGGIIWRWGGEFCKNNQFTFLNDPIGFSHQHHIRRLPNGNYTLFDNGNLHNPQFSRAAEYQLDQENEIAILVWENRNDPLTYSDAMGSAERLSNHNTVIGWGANNAPPDIKEVTAEGALKLSITLSDTTYCYRAFKYKWDTDLFTSDKDSLNFGVVSAGQSATLNFNLTNNYNQSVEINSVYNRNSAFDLQQSLPIAIPSQGTANLSVIFNPDTDGVYSDDIHLRWETEGQRIAKVIHLSGVTDSAYLGIDENLLLSGFSLSQNYPNPFNPVSKINYSIPHTSLVQLKVFDILGNEITTLVNKELTAGSYEVEFNGSDLASGIYFYRLIAGEFTSVKKMLLLK